MLLDELKFLNAKRTQIHSRKLRGKYLAFYFGYVLVGGRGGWGGLAWSG